MKYEDDIRITAVEFIDLMEADWRRERVAVRLCCVAYGFLFMLLVFLFAEYGLAPWYDAEFIVWFFPTAMMMCVAMIFVIES